MPTNNIEEYYCCTSPTINSVSHMDSDEYSVFPFVSTDYTAGIDDTVAEQLPEYTFVSGTLNHTFITSDKHNEYINEIDLSNDDVRATLLEMSSEEYQDLFEEGNPGSKNMYRVDTKIAPGRNIEILSETVVDGEINIDALNSGEEILVTYKGGSKPPFKAGETVTVYSSGATETGWGIGSISSAEVKIGAILQTHPDVIGEVKYHTVRNRREYNFLTTAAGADAMGIHCARYTEIFSSEPMDGGVIPSSAEMTLMSLTKLKREVFIKKITDISGMLFILILMILMGFAAYFNGIGMKIREKSYEISVLRAVGTPVSALRRRIILGSLKIPIIATATAYAILKSFQIVLRYVAQYVDDFWDARLNVPTPIDVKYESDFINFMVYGKFKMFMAQGVWMVNLEIPFLILFTFICAVTYILTAAALKKFKGNIAGDLNEGRKRR